MRPSFLPAVICGFLLFAFNAHAQSGWKWAKGPSQMNGMQTEAWITKTDLSNNVYVAGSAIFNSSNAFYIGPDTFHSILPCPSCAFGTAPFLGKYSENGIFKWAKYATYGCGQPFNIICDKNKNVYMLGYLFSDTMIIDSHILVKSAASLASSLFLIKFDSSGNILWSIIGTDVYSMGASYAPLGDITLDAQSNIYITALFGGEMGAWSGAPVTPVTSFSLGAFNLTNNDPSGITADILMAKIDPNGNVIWLKDYGSTGDDASSFIVTSKANKIYLSGQCASPFYMGSTTLTSSGNLFLAELDTAGNTIWVRGSEGFGFAYCSAIDSDCNVYIGGQIYGDSVAFDTFSLHVYPASQLMAGFVFKFDSAGHCTWSKNFSSPVTASASCVWGVAVDRCNRLWVDGLFVEAAVLDNVTTVLNVTTMTNDPDPFLAQYDKDGTLMEHVELPSGGDETAAICTDLKGNVYVGGDYGKDPFVVGPDTLHVPTSFFGGDEYFFIAKYMPASEGPCTTTTDTTTTPIVVNEIVKAHGSSIYPNPADNNIVIASAAKISSVVIKNLLGQIVYNGKYDSNNIEVNISRLRSGIYFVVINNIEVIKLIKR